MKKTASHEEISALQVNLAGSDEIAVLGLHGDFVGSEVVHFRRACGEAQKGGLKDFVVDLSEVSSIDGYGLASLVGLLSRVKNLEGRLILCAINPELRTRFEATHCDVIFDTEFTVAKAVDKLKGVRKGE